MEEIHKMWPTWLIVMLTILIKTIVDMLFGLAIFLLVFLRRKKNDIDIIVVDYHKEKGLTLRKRIGRFYTDPKRGRSLVTAGLGPNSVKENLGQKIGNDDIVASGEFRRKFVILGHKDGVYVPFKFAAENESFSLHPVKYEAVRFVLDTHKDAQDLYNDADKKNARALMWTAVGIFAIVVIGIIVILAIMVSQGPEFASKVASNGAKAAASAPALPTLPG